MAAAFELGGSGQVSLGFSNSLTPHFILILYGVFYPCSPCILVIASELVNHGIFNLGELLHHRLSPRRGPQGEINKINNSTSNYSADGYSFITDSQSLHFRILKATKNPKAVILLSDILGAFPNSQLVADAFAATGICPHSLICPMGKLTPNNIPKVCPIRAA
jgi:hypothetical protein